MALSEYSKDVEVVAEAVLKAWPLVRRDFPWRRSGDPWRTLLAEILLIQTKAEMVVKVYDRLIALFPTPCALTGVDTEQLEELLKPLGLYRQRAQRLLRMAEYLRRVYDCKVPCDYEMLRRIPGVGDYVAAAVYIVACGGSAPLLDANIARILSRTVLGVDPPRRYMTDGTLGRLAGLLKWDRKLAYAFIDFAAAFCTSRRPRCNACPLRSHCKYGNRCV
jgi:A/G-specific adenine glycosylase